jgi:predicted adenylyl cyclase CyaB
MKEIEAKLKLNDLAIIKKANLQKVKEVNVLDIYFDSDFLKLKSQDKVLRLRKEGDIAYIAYKGSREKHDNLVVRDETEPTISSFEDGLLILKSLGFYDIVKIEKKRSFFSIEKLPSLSVTLDEYPFIGLFIEIEGLEPEVYKFLEEFGFNLSSVIKKNCTEIFLDYCKENNLDLQNPEKHLTFQDEIDLKKREK